MQTESPRVLLIEGDPAGTRSILEALRADQAGAFTVEHAGGLSEAAEHLERVKPDVIVMALLPGDEPEAVGRLIRGHPEAAFVLRCPAESMQAVHRAAAGGTAFCVPDEPLNPSLLVNACRHAASFKRVNDAFRLGGDLVGRIVESSPNILYLYDLRQETVTHLNDRIGDLLGWSREQLVRGGTAFIWGLVHPDDVERLRKDFAERVMKAGPREVVGIEYRVRDSAGAWHWIEDRRVVLSWNAEGVPTQVLGCAQDVTERRRYEEQLQELGGKYRALMDNVCVGIAVIGPDMRVLTMNAQMKAWFPAADGPTAPPCHKVFRGPLSNGRCSECAVRDAVETGETCERLFYESGFPGEGRTFRVIASPVKGRAGEVLSVIKIMEEITDRVHSEETLRQNETKIRIAQEIQAELFPKHDPVLPGFDISGMSRPADATGGDYYDFIPMLYQYVGIVIADVSGHGLGPALLMAETRAYLRALAQTQADAGLMLTLANRLLSEDTAYERFVTAFFGRLNPFTRQFDYAGAGQQGFLLDSADEIMPLESTSIPLGLIHDRDYVCAPSITLEVGDIVCLFTDGVDDAMNDRDESYGQGRVLDLVRRNRDLSARGILEALYADVTRFMAGRPQIDDMTAVIIKCGESR